MSIDESPYLARSLFQAHPRNFAENRYVYPVLSRRAGGISIGVNLSLDRYCNYHCVYCQVDRSDLREARKQPVDIARLTEELDATIELVASGKLYEMPLFCDTPPDLRRLNDIALSGDGEPTAYVNFEDAVAACVDVRRRHGFSDVKLVLITNASLVHRERVRQALKLLDVNGGEIWAKLDAGTDEYYQLVARSAIPWQQILDNLRDMAKVRSIVVQSLFMRIHDEPPRSSELDAYSARLTDILAAGGHIKLVQVHTIARKPSESWVSALSNEEIDTIAQRIRRTGIPVAAFHNA
jgi:wyosine [tRNA(Phe)-imidazoG37] synthetase (radical SAM superfamily)